MATDSDDLLRWVLSNSPDAAQTAPPQVGAAIFDAASGEARRKRELLSALLDEAPDAKMRPPPQLDAAILVTGLETAVQSAVRSDRSAGRLAWLRRLAKATRLVRFFRPKRVVSEAPDSAETHSPITDERVPSRETHERVLLGMTEPKVFSGKTNLPKTRLRTIQDERERVRKESPEPLSDKRQIDDFNKLVPELRRLGMSVTNVSFDMSVPPRIHARLTGPLEALDTDRLIVIASGQDISNEMIRVILEISSIVVYTKKLQVQCHDINIDIEFGPPAVTASLVADGPPSSVPSSRGVPGAAVLLPRRDGQAETS
jgi:hypothetical protein